MPNRRNPYSSPYHNCIIEWTIKRAHDYWKVRNSPSRTSTLARQPKWFGSSNHRARWAPLPPPKTPIQWNITIHRVGWQSQLPEQQHPHQNIRNHYASHQVEILLGNIKQTQQTGIIIITLPINHHKRPVPIGSVCSLTGPEIYGLTHLSWR